MKLPLNDIAQGKGKVRFLLFEPGTKNLIRATPWSGNKIALNSDHGMNIILQHHKGDTTYPLEITRCRFGTGTTAKAAADTDLETPYASYFDKTNGYLNDASSATFEFFVPSADLPNDTYTEFGVYCGSQYFAGVLISPDLVKGSSQDVLAQYTLTYST